MTDETKNELTQIQYELGMVALTEFDPTEEPDWEQNYGTENVFIQESGAYFRVEKMLKKEEEDSYLKIITAYNTKRTEKHLRFLATLAGIFLTLNIITAIVLIILML